MQKKALIAMSGGVDSSVAAYLMKERGFDCIGITMKMFDSSQNSAEKRCCKEDDALDAKSVAENLGMPHYTLNFENEFENKVIKKFVNVYEEGKTPNPCIDCNRFIKFGSLFKTADELSTDYIATGHYAVVEYEENSGRYLLKRSADLSKDQSYVLYSLTQPQLGRVIFPLGGYTKNEIRALAGENNFATADKAESQDICFVEDGHYWEFIKQYTKKDYPSGNFVDSAGRVLGRHNGMICYTIGQRRGLGISAPNRLYVIGKDMEKNSVVLGEKDELTYSTATVDDINLISCDSLGGGMHVSVKTRYNMKPVEAYITHSGESKIKIEFYNPQFGDTPGQAAVFYDGDIVVGGGTITEAAN